MLFESYLKYRSERVCILAAYSSGVPQGFMLGSLMFSMYLKPICATIRKHKVDYEFFAVDGHLYLVFKSRIPGSLAAAKIGRVCQRSKEMAPQSYASDE